jgi:uncharacterized phage protein gp47/JayE
MAFTRPTLNEIVDQVEADFVYRLGTGEGAVLRRSVVRIFARVIAGAVHMTYGALDFLSRQLFPDTSEGDYLVRQASVFGLTQNPPTFATASIEFTGANTSVVPAGTLLTRSDGAAYTTSADATISGGIATAEVSAVVAGADGTCTTGVQLSLESPIVGVNSTAEVLDTIEDGVDQESVEALRVRLLERLATPAHGGTDADYVAWAKEVPGVTRAWVSPLELGPGTVVVRFVRDGDVSPIPDAGEVTAVQTKLDLEKPAHATVTAFAPTDSPLDLEIEITPDTTALRAAVTAELEDLFLRVSEPGATVLLSSIRTAIGSTAGITDYTLIDPVTNTTHTSNQLPSLGTITWS